jgi:hypothetical protein
MNRLLAAAAAAAGLLALSANVCAQSQEDTQKMLLGLYIVSIAIDTCDLDITKEQEQRLNHWTEWAEEKLNVSDRKLDKAYSAMEQEAEKDKEKFCAQMKPVALKTVKELP